MSICFFSYISHVKKVLVYLCFGIQLLLCTTCKSQSITNQNQLTGREIPQEFINKELSFKQQKQANPTTSIQKHISWIVGVLITFFVAFFAYLFYYKWQNDPDSNLPYPSSDDDINPMLDNQTNHPPLSDEQALAIRNIAQKIKNGDFSKIGICSGAGISTNAGIPDFRSKGGFYDSVKKYYKEHHKPMPSILVNAEKFYTDDYIRQYPDDFYDILEYAGKFKSAKPTYTHYFIKKLHDHNLLAKYWTQNIDNLEEQVGLPEEKVHCYHGKRGEGGRCVVCKEYSSKQDCHYKGKVPTCRKEKNGQICGGVIKPGTIVFFKDAVVQDLDIDKITQDLDFILILGTGLNVTPFANIPHKVKETAYRLFITKELSEHVQNRFKRPHDLVILNDCDFVISQLVDSLGWQEDMKELIQQSSA